MPSMDIVCKPDLHEVRNAVEQASKELKTRFDFKGTDAEIVELDDSFKLTANTEDRVKAVSDVLLDKFVKRKLSPHFLDPKDPTPSGARWTMNVALKKSLDQETAKKIVALIKENKQWKVTASILGDKKSGETKVKVEGKQTDDLQAIYRFLLGKQEELKAAVAIENRKS